MRAGKDGAPITDGVFPEAKEFLAGYWIVDVESPEQAYADCRARLGGAGYRRRSDEYADRSAPGDERAAPRIAVMSGSVGCRFRAPVARTRAAGAGRRHPPFPRFRRRRGCGAGGAGGGGRAMAARRAPRQSARLADSGGFAAHDRSRAQRGGPAPAGNGGCAAVGPGGAAADAAQDSGQDDTLILLFMCCHAALTPASAIALTLRAVGGLTTAEIAKAFLVPEATMAQRISRAKRTSKLPACPSACRPPRSGPQRLRAVLHVLYLIFNEGYTTSAGPELQRVELSHEAIRLTRAVYQPAAGRCRSCRTAGADAADRCAPRGAHRPGGRADSAHRAGSHAVGSAARSPRASRCSRRRCRRERSARISYRPPSPPFMTKRRRPKTRTGRRFWRCTIC